MRYSLSIIAVFLTLFFASCEDKDSSRKSAAETVAEKMEESDSAAVETTKNNTEDEENEEETDLGEAYPIPQEELIPFLTQYGKENPENRVRIITSFGNIEVTLFRDTPLHRANFIMLVKNGYFDNTYFHRVAPGFVIQGGNSDNEATYEMRQKVGKYLIPSEFDAGHKHTYGAFSAAKYSEQNVSKASSPFEFFIVMDKGGSPHLNNDHTVFGRVTSGIDVAEKIEQVETGQSEWPIDNIHMDVEIIE
ncbi:peptidylprolyl isomerase [Salegentibacter sp. F188]|uniref:Peptidyl-prolyl cis-trans isomerase n=1 Tax=Autumnicola patrickiae TaxID=3075591 RepID=A0ABU3E059_9FLAO|nr:peptidylprolyl isomerase [Salegentibacter sp. F188]MDT0689054.1 peptidylprolyl isomerase [Salegentibacter sp. F188]